MKISVAMCTYNGSKFIEQQLESILNQTVEPSEVVVCDDNSTDNTYSILEAFQASYPDIIKLFKNNKRVGRITNFNNAISICSGDIVVLSDQDDVFLPYKFERLLDVFVSDPTCGLAFSDATVVDEELNPISTSQFSAIWPSFDSTRQAKLRDGRGYEVINKNTPAIGCSMAFRKNLTKYILPIPPNAAHDFWILAIAIAFTNIRIIEEPLVLYRQHGENLAGLQVGILKKLKKRMIRNPDDYYYEITKSVESWEQMKERLVKFDAEINESTNEAMLHLINGKLWYVLEKERIAGKSASFLEKLWCIFSLLMKNGYGQYGRGVYDLFRDLVSLYLRLKEKIRTQTPGQMIT